MSAGGSGKSDYYLELLMFIGASIVALVLIGYHMQDSPSSQLGRAVIVKQTPEARVQPEKEKATPEQAPPPPEDKRQLADTTGLQVPEGKVKEVPLVKAVQEQKVASLPPPPLATHVPLTEQQTHAIIKDLLEADSFLEPDFWRRAGRSADKLIKAGSPAWDIIASAIKEEKDEFARARLNTVLACMRWKFSPYLLFRLDSDFMGELYTSEVPSKGEWFASLEKFYKDKNAPALIKAFELKDPDASYYIFDFVEKLGQVALKPLLEALMKEEHPYMAFCIRIALMRLTPGTLADLREFAHDEKEEVRALAMRALGLSGTREAAPALARGLKDKSPIVRYNAASMLSVIPDRRAVKYLVEALEDSDDDVAYAAARALGAIGNPAAIEPLLEYFRSGREGAMQGAASSLAGIGQQSAEFLLPFLKDPQEEARVASVAALAELRSASTVDHLLKALSDESKNVRYGVVDALGYIGGNGVIEALKKEFADPDPDIRGAAARSLGRLRAVAAVDALAAMLEDDVASVRIATIIAIGKIGGKRALEILTKSLASTELGSLAAQSIEKYGAAAGPVLVVAMPKMPAQAKCSIARLLAQARVEPAVPVLIDNLNDPSIDVRFCAQKALKIITGHETSYKCDVPDTERAKGQEEWRRWWKQHREKK